MTVRHILPLLFLLLAQWPLKVHAETRTFALVSDVQRVNERNWRIAQSMLDSGIRNVIMAGDMMADKSSHYDATWARWKNSGFSFDAVGHGNHHLGLEVERQYFGMPADYYAVSHGPIRFIVLFSEDSDKTLDRQGEWLTHELSSAAEPFVFVLFHRPPVTVAQNHPWPEKAHFQQMVTPILQSFRHKITAVFAGHVHLTSVLDWNGIPLVLSSATASALSGIPPVRSRANGYSASTVWLNDQPHLHWIRVDAIRETGEVWLNIINVERNSVDCSMEIAKHRFLARENCSATTTRRPTIDIE